MNQTSGWEVIVKGVLFFTITASLPVVNLYAHCASEHYTPERVELISAVLVGLQSAMAAGLAYLSKTYANFTAGGKP